ncbi:DUF4124 domain-containing protein [Halopseudomonas pelagia]|uniref:DUF4124 domain-containing protein n=1 Tax=Halopseudomonas pelagia TaxID=553151 RepID=UPI0003AA02EA|nr:DUF4124 domain-containing protein [Halopseudomonas pelagia]|tara:strand:- start:350 stop:784 length:435 start_codon:yes stop_codon:yes gene_type:complete
MYKTLIALTLSLLSSAASAEQMYRWVDDQGIPQFGQQPPQGRSYQRVDIISAPPPGGTLRAPAPLTKSEAPSEEPRQNQAANDKAMEAQRLEQCRQLQANLHTMETNPRLSRTNDAGEVERIGEDERQALITQTKIDLENYCKN